MKEKTAELLRKKVREDYNAIAESFSRSRSVLWPELRFFKDYLHNNISVLDIGCGNARVYDLLRDVSIREYVGLDVSRGLLEEAKKRYANVWSTHMNFVEGDMLALPFPDEHFDVVFLIAVLQHAPGSEARQHALAEAHRVLKKGGFLFMTNWDLWQFRYARLPWKMFFGKIFTPFHKITPEGLRYCDFDFGDAVVPWKESEVRRYYHAFRKGELKKLLRETGFHIRFHQYVRQKEEMKRTFVCRAYNILTVAKK